MFYLFLPLLLQLLQPPLPLLLLFLGSLLLLQKQFNHFQISSTHPIMISMTTSPTMPHLLHLGQGLLHGLHCGLARSLLLLVFILVFLSFLLLLVFLLFVALRLLCRRRRNPSH